MKDNISFAELAKKRQSDRKYKDQAVEREKLIQCLETARISPSANNSQPWKFVIIDDATLVKQIGAMIANNPLGINKFAETAPVLVAVVEEEAKLMAKADGKVAGDRWAKFDLGSATEHFCLQAAELGLGTCIMGAFDAVAVKDALGLPEERNIFVMLAVGHPAGSTRTKMRKEVETICCFNRYEA